MQKTTLTMIFMRKLFFGALALVMGAFVFVSCEDNEKIEEEKGREKGTYFSMAEQQQLFSQAFIDAGNTVDFSGLAQSVGTIAGELGAKNVNWIGGFEAMMADSVLADRMIAISLGYDWKEIVKEIMSDSVMWSEIKYMQSEEEIMGALDSLLDDSIWALKIMDLKDRIEEIDINTLYFGVELEMVKDTADTVINVVLKKADYNADRFKVDIKTLSGRTISASFKIATDKENTARIGISSDEEKFDFSLPTLIDFSLKVDGQNVLGYYGDLDSDFAADATLTESSEGGDSLISLLINGTKLGMHGKLAVGDCSFSGNFDYDATSTVLGMGGKIMSGRKEIMSVNAGVNVSLYPGMDYANTMMLGIWAMSYINDFDVSASLNEDQIIMKAKYKGNPLPTLMGVSGADDTEMPALIDTLNAHLDCGIYFKGFDEPQAKIIFAREKPAEEVDLSGETDMKKVVIGGIANSGLYVAVKTYDDKGRDIIVPASRYFSGINVEEFSNSMEQKFNQAFAAVLAPLFQVTEEEFDLTDLIMHLLMPKAEFEDYPID